MTDPISLILAQLKDKWTAPGVTPSYTESEYNEKAKLPQVVVSHVLTTPAVLGLSESLDEDERLYVGNYNVDVWSTSKDERWKMMNEVDRIFQSLIYGDEDIDQYQPRSWRDIPTFETHPRLFRSQILIEVRYYK